MRVFKLAMKVLALGSVIRNATEDRTVSSAEAEQIAEGTVDLIGELIDAGNLPLQARRILASSFRELADRLAPR